MMQIIAKFAVHLFIKDAQIQSATLSEVERRDSVKSAEVRQNLGKEVI